MNDTVDPFQQIDNIFVDTTSDILSGAFLFLLGVLALFCIKGYFQYLLAKKEKHKNPWFAFLFCFSLAQWWQLGGISLLWALIIFIPSILDLVLSNVFVLISILIVFLVLIGITIKATLGIAKRHKLSPGFTYLLFLPFVRLWVLNLMGEKNKTPKEAGKKKVVLLTVGSLVLTVLLWGLLLYISFGESMLLVYEHVSDPSVTPISIFNDFINAEISK